MPKLLIFVFPSFQADDIATAQNLEGLRYVFPRNISFDSSISSVSYNHRFRFRQYHVKSSTASKIKLGFKNVVPLLPDIEVIVIVFVPATRVPDGMLTS